MNLKTLQLGFILVGLMIFAQMAFAWYDYPYFLSYDPYYGYGSGYYNYYPYYDGYGGYGGYGGYYGGYGGFYGSYDSLAYNPYSYYRYDQYSYYPYYSGAYANYITPVFYG